MFPETSLEAYYALTPEKVEKDHQRIFFALRLLKEANYEEISAHCSLPPDAVGRRLKEMEQRGLIHKTGRRRTTKRGRAAFTYMIPECQLKIFP